MGFYTKQLLLPVITYSVGFSIFTAKWIWDSSIFFLLKQNLTCDCLLISVYYLNFHELNLKLLWTSKQNNFKFWSDKFSQISNTEINKPVKFWFNRKNMELSHIYYAVHWYKKCFFGWLFSEFPESTTCFCLMLF